MRSTAWQEGYDAFHAKGYPENPYIDVEEFDDWENGWQAAYDEYYGPEDENRRDNS